MPTVCRSEVVKRRREPRDLRKYNRIESNNTSPAIKIVNSSGVICLTITA